MELRGLVYAATAYRIVYQATSAWHGACMAGGDGGMREVERRSEEMARQIQDLRTKVGLLNIQFSTPSIFCFAALLLFQLI